MFIELICYASLIFNSIGILLKHTSDEIALMQCTVLLYNQKKFYLYLEQNQHLKTSQTLSVGKWKNVQIGRDLSANQYLKSSWNQMPQNCIRSSLTVSCLNIMGKKGPTCRRKGQQLLYGSYYITGIFSSRLHLYLYNKSNFNANYHSRPRTFTVFFSIIIFTCIIYYFFYLPHKKL